MNEKVKKKDENGKPYFDFVDNSNALKLLNKITGFL